MVIEKHKFKTKLQSENQRISMRIDLEVLNSFDLIIKTSTMQSVDESVSVCLCKQSMPSYRVTETE